jgi:hypothetical protein
MPIFKKRDVIAIDSEEIPVRGRDFSARPKDGEETVEINIDVNDNKPFGRVAVYNVKGEPDKPRKHV